ncbi:MAG TPA: peptide chain release factor N(5)-glutamine methyltransferase [Steroidobacteraceae bacterium]|jgi:release factor glutamine methyltransferase|nr:peptide chain release factor N(5)-glutamine methyltransferase [Steroidobacteraceae bacterium]
MPDPSESSRLLANAAHTIERRDAEILLARCWNKTRAQLLVHMGESVPAEVAARFEDACRQRAAGVPVAYLLGVREFWSLEFAVNPAVLVPRPETELLVERVLQLVTTAEASVADLGTGSGAIAIALAHERPNWRLLGTDTSPEALAVARGNGERLVDGRVEWALGDWYAALARRRFHALASNPPYIAGADAVLGGDGLRHEPRGALTPGGDGLAALATLINGAPEHLLPGGWLALEHGQTQGEPVRSLLVARGFTHVTSHRDLAGHERVTEGNLAT